MFNESKKLRFLILSFAVAGFVLISGSLNETSAQRDPFAMPGYAKPKIARPTSGGGGPTEQPEKPKGPNIVTPPSIEQRISYYKSMREQAALNGLEIPKVTSVLTLNEMSVTGIFKTPRGYAAMVEAKPIKLSYTIYPGEKFFDGQLVAVEENRLVFRKVTKMSNNKFISSVENMTLRQYSTQEEVQGTAPIAGSGVTESARVAPIELPTPGPIVSPLDEMNSQPKEETKSPAKKGKKPVKVAKGKRQ